MCINPNVHEKLSSLCNKAIRWTKVLAHEMESDIQSSGYTGGGGGSGGSGDDDAGDGGGGNDADDTQGGGYTDSGGGGGSGGSGDDDAGGGGGDDAGGAGGAEVHVMSAAAAAAAQQQQQQSSLKQRSVLSGPPPPLASALLLRSMYTSRIRENCDVIYYYPPLPYHGMVGHVYVPGTLSRYTAVRDHPIRHACVQVYVRARVRTRVRACIGAGARVNFVCAYMQIRVCEYALSPRVAKCSSVAARGFLRCTQPGQWRGVHGGIRVCGERG